MKKIYFPMSEKIKILSLGAESAGVFSFYENENIFVSENFGDIINEENFEKFKKSVFYQIKKTKPDVILTDIHPIYNSTVLGEKISKELKIPRIKIQHHLAHIFSSFGDRIIENANNCRFMEKSKLKNEKKIFGIASDGTGFGFDKNIWGGEIFQIKTKRKNKKKKKSKIIECPEQIKRIGSLEEQTMIGGDLAIMEPARMLISILPKFMTKEETFSFIKKYYSKNEFELLYNQMMQNFNCQKTTSAGRILDAVSLFLGFAQNKRDYKHEAAKALDSISSSSYKDIEPKIENYQEQRKIINTTYLFEYLAKNINKDKKRLAVASQMYLAKGFYKALEEASNKECKNHPVFFSGGISNNKIISSYLEKKNVYISKNIPRGDEGIAFGQIVYFNWTISSYN